MFRRIRRGAFTLVEVLVALALMAVVLAAAQRLLAAGMGQDAALRRSEAARAAVGTLAEMLVQDLSCICPVELDAVVLREGWGVRSNTRTLSLLVATGGAPGEAAAAPDVRLVEWRLVQPRRASGVELWRSVEPFSSPDQRPGRGLLLTDALEEFEARFWDGSSWARTWPPEPGAPLPGAVRVTFRLAAETGQPPHELLVPLRVEPVAQAHARGEAARAE